MALSAPGIEAADPVARASQALADLGDAPLSIVDVETTGAHPAFDRITEIAVIEIEGGEAACTWSSLVNPDTPIPPAIQALTGISNAMVAGAPRFADLAAALHERLAGRVLVAHNARFDYGFLRSEFERAGYDYRARTLCTVRLSRRLYPGEARHSLDALIARHRIACDERHRALGDAEVLWRFLCLAAEEHGVEALRAAASRQWAAPALPPHLDRAAIEEIPQAPGVYLFYGEDGAPLYVGHSASLRSRVLAHFAGAHRSGRALELARELRRIDWERTAGALGAQLREAELVKSLAPRHNRRLRRAPGLCGFAFEPDADPRGRPGRALRLVGIEGLAPAALAGLRGVFRSEHAARAALRELADRHALCLRRLGLERAQPGERPCFRHQIGRCAGVCAGAEAPAAHDARLAAALARLDSLAWPYRGAIGVPEADAGGEREEVHVFDHWCHVGTARSEDELSDLLRRPGRVEFDPDRYRLLARHLARRGARWIDLAGRGDMGDRAAGRAA